MYDVQALIGVVESIVKRKISGAPIVRAPGRVEVLGNHTDYNGGMVLAATIERYVWSVGVADTRTRVCSREFNDCVTIPDGPIGKMTVLDWKSYIKGVHWAFDKAGHRERGLCAAIGGDVPRGAGVSSSAALEVSYAGLLNVLGRLGLRDKELATKAYEAERLYCGVSCGVMDQFTSQLCRKDSMLAIDCVTLETSDTPLDPELRLVVVDSMVKRSAAEALNQRRRECMEAVEILKREGWRIENLAQIAPEQIPQIERVLDASILNRAVHVITENARVKHGISLLGQKRTVEFGQLMGESHRSSRDLYEVSHPKLDLLVEIASRQKGVLGARMTGAGLGGAILALVKEKHAESFQRQVGSAYEKETGVSPAIITGGIPGGATVTTV